MCDAHKDEKLQNLRAICGFQGIGRWWLLLEIIAEQLPNNGERDFATIHEDILKEKLDFYHTKTLLKYLGILKRLGLISELSTTNVGIMWDKSIPNLVVISVKNLIKIRDSRPQKEKEKEIKKNANFEFKKKNPKMKDPSIEDWSKIIDHVHRKGSQTPISGISEEGRAALLKIGGLMTVGQSDSHKLSFLKNDFKNAYLRI